MILPLGFALALLGSMPMSGPVAVVFMVRALNAERRAAFLVALGGAVVEAAYALALALAVPRLVGRTAGLLLGALALGSLVVTGLGITLLVRPDLIQRSAGRGAERGFLRGALSSVLNPTLLATWSVAVGTLYANGWLERKASSAFGFALGVGLGSIAWFSAVLALITHFRRGVTPTLRRNALRAMGVVLVLSGVYLGARFASLLGAEHTRLAARQRARPALLLAVANATPPRATHGSDIRATERRNVARRRELRTSRSSRAAAAGLERDAFERRHAGCNAGCNDRRARHVAE